MDLQLNLKLKKNILNISIISIIYKDDKEVKVFSKISLNNSLKIDNQKYSKVDLGNKKDYEKIIEELKIIYENYWKKNNEINNVFIHDENNVLKNLTSDQSGKSSTTIVAKNGIVQGNKKLVLFNGQIISTQKESLNNNVIKFEQLNINLDTLSTGTIKIPKLQETSTYELLKCNFQKFSNDTNILNCKKSAEEEIKTILNRRFVLPFYIPIISLICSFLIIRPDKKKNFFLNKYTIFAISFLILLYAELIVRYTGISTLINFLFFISPLILVPIIYVLLIYKLSKESVVIK